MRCSDAGGTRLSRRNIPTRDTEGSPVCGPDVERSGEHRGDLVVPGPEALPEPLPRLAPGLHRRSRSRGRAWAVATRAQMVPSAPVARGSQHATGASVVTELLRQINFGEGAEGDCTIVREDNAARSGANAQ